MVTGLSAVPFTKGTCSANLVIYVRAYTEPMDCQANVSKDVFDAFHAPMVKLTF